MRFSDAIWHWRGPAPYYFVTVPQDESDEIHALSSMLTYGWGMIPVKARIGKTTWETAMFRKDERYVLPLKLAVRTAERVELGDTVSVVISPTRG
jgi:hypothetical protein